MVKIIKAGTINKVVCDNCGALLSYENEDIKTIESFSQDPLTGRCSKKVITCRQCKELVTLSSTK